MLLKIIYILSISAVILGCDSSSKKELIGTWNGIDKDKKAIFNFYEDSTSKIEMDNAIIGGENYILNGLPAQLHFSTDENQQPKHIDFVMKDGDGEFLFAIHGIYKNLTAEEIEMCLNFESSDRPTTFIPEDTFVLKRKSTE